MKILLFAFASSFTENLHYKENYYFKLFQQLGHQVIVYSNNSVIINGKLVPVKESITKNLNGVIIRKKYSFFINSFISSKIRKFSKFYTFLKQNAPDIVITFGLQSFDLITIAKYKRKLNKNILFICESHEDFNNSARSFISRFILHKIIYNAFIKLSNKYIDHFFYITYETKAFISKVYNINSQKLIYSPLGGSILDDFDYQTLRIKKRSEYLLKDNDVLFFHSGKINKSKKTVELIKSFKSLPFTNMKLFIAGSIDSSIKSDLFNLIKDDLRIRFIGWLNSFDLVSTLSATDIYVQPGSQSATLQVAACMRCGIIAYDHSSYRHLFNQNILYIKVNEDIDKNIRFVMANPLNLEKLRVSTFNIANSFLNYNKQVDFIIHLYNKINTLNIN